MKIAAFQALDKHAAATEVNRLRGLKAHAERSTPAEAGRKAELRARMLAQFGWDRHAIHGGHRSLGAKSRQTEAKVGSARILNAGDTAKQRIEAIGRAGRKCGGCGAHPFEGKRMRHSERRGVHRREFCDPTAIGIRAEVGVAEAPPSWLSYG